MSTWEATIAILGLGVITVLTRAFFLLPQREVPIPLWLREALRYAPLAALVAVIAPEVIMKDGHLIRTWQDARLYAAAAGALWYWWRRGILGTIVCGTAVLLALRFGLGW
ncbi:MAG TPA: AzlD domain-containing protein [Ideonella sp.]|uniref:AzlD domain-containing protein n=1 Tax=Ideonella sp. TaxID=1929293 RepID=UPI002E30C1FA|nr:AzlD domain-containing protein [Ideonella sp.]HEX5684774.1 AzlD domain-containing protein [Ideonella sp.]